MSVNSRDRSSHDFGKMNATIPLTPEEIHLWLAFYDEITDERLLSDYLALLNSAEKEQQSRFYFANEHRYSSFRSAADSPDARRFTVSAYARFRWPFLHY